MRLSNTGFILALFIATLTVFSSISESLAQTAGTDQNMTFAPNVGAGADLFSAQGTASIPIDVPSGRHGIQPALSLQYSSSNANGWVGLGWKLDVGSVERNTRFGLNYSGDDYVFRLSGANTDLVNIGIGEYRAKIEGGFSRVRKLTGQGGWEATDKKGIRYLFGQTAASRMADPADASRIFKWCLDQVIDPNGNYMTVTYVGDQGEGYLQRIDYTGNGSTQPTNTVKFYLESRSDASPMYTTNYQVITAKRLKTIDVLANGNRVRTYKLGYATSTSTSRSLLSTVQQYGKDAAVDGSGTVTGGSALPTSTFSSTGSANNFNTPTQWLGDNGPSGATYNQYHQYVGDFNGDGKADWMYNYNGWYVALSNGHGFDPPTLWMTDSGPGGPTWSAYGVYQFIGDFNGDGKTDFMYNNINNGQWYVMLSNGHGFDTPTQWLSGTGPTGPTANQYHQYVGDFNGDGKADYMYNYNGWYVALSNGNGFNAPTLWMTDSGPGGPTWSAYGTYQRVGDFNGDGKLDFMYNNINNNFWYVMLSNGNSFNAPTQWLSNVGPSGYTYNQYHQYYQDFNGDGKTDYMYYNNGWYVALSTGSGFTPPTLWLSSTGPSGVTLGSNYYYQFIGDFNGDGKNDYLYHNNGWHVALSTGNSFTYPTLWLSSNGPTGQTYNQYHMRVGDFNGDGKADFLYNYLGWHVALQDGMGDLLSSVNNGIGGLTTIRYVPSTLYSNTQLPFPVQTVNFIKTEDGNGNVSVTNYDYNGGFYHIGERDFRGFNFVKTSGPIGPNGEQAITETWFHQGNDLDINTNTPNVPNGYMKGKPYRVKVTDGANLYSQSTTTYASGPSTAPFFNPPLQVDSSTCDGGACGKQTRSIFTYDAYGNVTREDQYGDLNDASDDRTVVRSFGFNTTAWIVGLPTSETIYQGIGLSGQAAQTSFYYDGTTSCGGASSNQVPTQGNLTRVVRWLSGGTSSETRMAYDPYGNLICTRDANGNTSTLSYDGTATFPKIAISALGHQKITQYYGVDGMAMDTGLYGQVRSVTDPNNATITTSYDVFGRRAQVNFPEGGWTVFAYNSFGTVGAQHVQTTTAVGLSSWTYFDGLGRTIMALNTGPDGKSVAMATRFNARGAVGWTTLPYFYGSEAPSWKTFVYDPLGRVIQATNPDGSRILGCTSNWVTTAIDANNHRKRETRDAYGRLLRVDEYAGTFSTCTTDPGGPYATTTYQYDVLGNLRFVTDTKGNQSEMRYDSLSRKIFMHDPDMGNWTYAYDPAGNLTSQTDAKGQVIFFQYDPLNRRRQKDYGAQKGLGSGDVVYTYDGATSYGKGRLTFVRDQSGTVTFYYEALGRTVRSDKSLDGTTYITRTVYDLGGRVSSVMYPDPNHGVANYAYNGPVLQRIYEGATNYAQYASYNALGQPGTLTTGNGVVTNYTYASLSNATCSQQNFRPCTIKTQLGANTAYQNLTYNYDVGGNITWLTDAVNGNQSFGYDDLNRLTSATGPYGNFTYTYDEIGNLLSNPQIGTYGYPASGAGSVGPHAVNTAGGNSYGYDATGTRQWAWTWDPASASGVWQYIYPDYENRPSWISQQTWTQSSGWTPTVWTGMYYDGDGGRVKKMVWDQNTGWRTTRFIGKLYECEETACSRYIFAGSQRIAVLPDTGTPFYYHSDHLGSSSVITDATGAKVQAVTYYPYGATRTNTPSSSPAVDVPYKYTGIELDGSTGLYFYEARYYDPVLGRFVSADTIVPGASDPQSLNRYSYVRNNPILYIDPTGHHFLGSIGKFFSSSVGRAVGYALVAPAGLLFDSSARNAAINLSASVNPAVAAGIISREQYREILAAEIIAGTAVATFYCGGCGAVATGALWGALVGEVTGAVSSRGDVLSGVVMGGLTGAATGAVMGEVGVFTKGLDPVERILVKAAVGGVISEIRGGEFGAGFAAAAGSAVFGEVFEYSRTHLQLPPGDTGTDASGMKNVFGDRACLPGPCSMILPEAQTGSIIKQLGAIGVWLNATGYMHDFSNQLQGGYVAGYQVYGAVSDWQNYATMPFAAGITAIARDGGVLSVDYATRRSR